MRTTRLLIANRGEIARRVIRTCRARGISPIAVFSDEDADAVHVAEADAAVRLPGRTPAETYLRADRLVEAALAAGADAVHPGYGFLSENAEFARAVLRAELTWVGPPAEVVEAMGSKIRSKRLMADAGVPSFAELDPAALREEDVPVLVKASAGGGGRGMRVVRSLEDVAVEIAAARAEAGSAFGDPAVFCEPLVEDARHIEVQVLADTHGTVWTLGERECSIQRRHQKVVEETPSPAVDEQMRERLNDAARSAVKAIGYVGAGTVEFLADDAGRFWFLEMNTRLQVEHPVTECVTGLDLVGLQIAIAEGDRLPPEPPAARGHAIETRLYAEDAEGLPGTGVLHRFDIPDVDVEFGIPASYGVRLDSGVRDGANVGSRYDPMLAKVIAWAPTRSEASRRLANTLARARIHGLTTNRDLLVRVLRHADFSSGRTDTGFLNRHRDLLSKPLADAECEAISAVVAALAEAAVNRGEAAVCGGMPSGWRNIPALPQRKRYVGDHGEYDIAYRTTRAGVAVDGRSDVTVVETGPDRVVLDVGMVRRSFQVAFHDASVWVDSDLGPVELARPGRFPDGEVEAEPGSLIASIPGTVTRIAVSEGDSVAAGQSLLWIEAMKMEHKITAPVAGVVDQLLVSGGHQVDKGEVLAVVRPRTKETA